MALPVGRMHRQGGGGFVGGQEDVVGDVVVRVLARGRVPHVEQAPPGAGRERRLRSAACRNPFRLRGCLGGQSSPLSAKLVQFAPADHHVVEDAHIDETQRGFEGLGEVLVGARGSHWPLGCGWPKITPPALWCSARLTTSRG